MRLFLCFVFFATLNCIRSQHVLDYSRVLSDSIVFFNMDQPISIQEVVRYPDGETGGMHNNWSMVTYELSQEEFVSNWYPMSKDSNYVFNWDTFLEGGSPLNGSKALFGKDQQLISYGGFGYGSFDHTDYVRFNDTVVATITSCVGHCGNFMNRSVGYIVYNTEGTIAYTISTPVELSIDTSDAVVNELWKNSETFEEADTTFYHYTNDLLYIPQELNDLSKEGIYSYLSKSAPTHNSFFQLYINQTPMKEWLADSLGSTPPIVGFEIYHSAAIYFNYDEQQDQYTNSAFFFLE